MDFGFFASDHASSTGGRRLHTTRFASPDSTTDSHGQSESIRRSSMRSESPSFRPFKRQRTPNFAYTARNDEFSDVHSRVWEVYVEKANKADSMMLDGWNRSIDVLLVFTGLFSAVLTTFIIEAYHLITPDPADMTNELLNQLIAMRNGSVVPPSTAPAVTSRASWVNGLWFASLSCSLSTALLSMLVKQWLQAYVAHESGSTYQRARQRQQRYMNLTAWHVPTIINGLPVLLHASLLLFFIGLILLLWPADLPVTIATWIIIGMVQLFFAISVFMPLLYPGCPYHHPISEYLSRWVESRKTLQPRVLLSPQAPGGVRPDIAREMRFHHLHSSTDDTDDELDAKALAWLLAVTTDSEVRTATLHGIAAFPRQFSGFKTLREAGALRLVEQAFLECFHRDTTVELRWHLVDVDGAETLCRAWLNLTRDTNEQWPIEIVEPLWILQDLKHHPDTAAIASCAIAMSSFDSMHAQWEVISYLGMAASGRISLSQGTQAWLLESIVECIYRWEVPIAVAEETGAKAVPILLHLLRFAEDSPTSELRTAVALALYMLTCEPLNPADYRAETKRSEEYCGLLVRALSSIVAYPERFAVSTALLDMVAHALARLATPILSQTIPFPDALRDVAKPALSKMYTDGRIVPGPLSDQTVADVLHLIFPPTQVPLDRRPAFVTSLLENLEMSSHPDVVNWSIRSLEVLLSQYSPLVSDAFVENDGISAVLRSAKVGVDTGRLQIDSIRTLCAFAQSCASHHVRNRQHSSIQSPAHHFDSIFRSDFFETLAFVLASRRKSAFKQPQSWWLNEVSRYWLPALVQLCHVRPQEPVWPTVVAVIQDFAESNGEMVIGYRDSLASLNTIVMMIQSVPNGQQPGTSSAT
ncbi:hypothetical protein HGRIS_002801 [Hohenbuehelia grisea]|uniref:DUF6535 domain-containing protein n=1 Tax=Hohenbuehelia grisea TaxID=104357 RepID=A0ABR3JMH7_9AGAR